MSDKIKRERAFELWMQSGGAGKRKSIEALWKGWVDTCRDNPAARADIPTLNRATVYKWAKEDDWESRAAERDQAETQFMRETYEKARQRGVDSLNLLIEQAVGTLGEATQEAAWRERIAAANSILDRVGLVPLNKVKPSNEKPKKNTPKLPPVDATDEELIAYMQELHGGQHGESD